MNVFNELTQEKQGRNKTKDWALVQNAALVGVKVNLGYVGLSWLGNLT